MFELVVRGRPAPQGSKRGVARTTGKGADLKIVGIRQIEMSPHVGVWRDDVKAAAETRIGLTGHKPWDCPLRVRMVFTVRKPASAPKRRRTWPGTMPDLSKLCRSTEDALTAAGVWKDDARVVEYTRLAKVYPGEDPEALEVPGVRISVEPVTDEQEGFNAILA
jgi:Holliday junction resolvase RusA-like endonuclease